MKWRDVFDSNKLTERDYDSCAKIVKSVGYKYMSFNGYVYAINIPFKSNDNPICDIDDLN